MSRLLRWLTYGAFVMELLTLLHQMADRRIDRELAFMLEAAHRP